MLTHEVCVLIVSMLSQMETVIFFIMLGFTIKNGLYIWCESN